MPNDLLDVLSEITASSWSGTVFRVTLGDAPVDGENTRGARWNPPGTPAIYASLEPETAIAEVEYNLRQQRFALRRDLRKTVHEIRVALRSVVDLKNAAAKLDQIGFNAAKLFSDDMQASQKVGAQATWLNHDGILVPSARSQGTNLVIYPSRASQKAYRFEAISSRQL